MSSNNEQFGTGVQRVELADDDLEFIRSVLDEKVSNGSIPEQDKAIELIEKLPETSTRGL